MNNNLTELVYILDMSGSMSHLTDDTINGYNRLLEEQRKQNRENPNLKANVTTVFFDDRYIMIHDRENLDNVKDITTADYCPTGMTAMLDAVGRTVVSVGQKLTATPEEERPGLVSVTIITDGQENYSKEYNWAQIHEMIKEQREKYSWLFSFIGANIDVEVTAEQLGIAKGMSATYSCTADSLNTVYDSITVAATNARNAVATTGSVATAAGYYSDALNKISTESYKAYATCESPIFTTLTGNTITIGGND